MTETETEASGPRQAPDARRGEDGIEAVLFDMDGVLVDSEPVHMRAWQEILLPLGHPATEADLLPWVGVPDRDLARHLAESGAVDLAAETLLLRKGEVYRAIMRRERPVPPGLREALETLAARLGAGRTDGPSLAVVTTSPREDMEAVLGAAGLRDFFPVIVTGCDVARHKPDPEPYRAAIARLGARPQRCVVLEDSPSGVAAGRAAGCTVLGILGMHDAAALPEADLHFSAPTDALAWILTRLDEREPNLSA
jgi:HAD superfamily hydrolase (TIGR01509 family)